MVDDWRIWETAESSTFVAGGSGLEAGGPGAEAGGSRLEAEGLVLKAEALGGGRWLKVEGWKFPAIQRIFSVLFL